MPGRRLRRICSNKGLGLLKFLVVEAGGLDLVLWASRGCFWGICDDSGIWRFGGFLGFVPLAATLCGLIEFFK